MELHLHERAHCTGASVRRHVLRRLWMAANEIGQFDQRIQLLRQQRHFGGGRWYFECPDGTVCSAVWMPPGTRSFASRETWGRQVAYSSQFQSRHDRALNKAQALRAGLAGPNWAGIDEFDPPKPKWMRWSTYDRIVERSRQCEAIADQRLFRLFSRWTGGS